VTIDEGQVRVVPTTTQVGAAFVVSGKGDPSWTNVTVGVDEIHRDLFPVAFVIVDAVGPGSPVVEVVEEPVLEHDVAGAAHGAAVIRVVAMVRPVPVEHRGRRLRPSRGASAGQKRDASTGIDEPGQYTDPTEAGLGPETWPVAAVLPAEVLGS
jgi:hypothetical protein